MRIDGVAVDPTEPLHDWTPVGVPGLFALVRQAIDGDRTKVTYDPATGVPVAMESDPMENADRRRAVVHVDRLDARSAR